MKAGTRGVDALGLDFDDKRPTKLPRHRLPSGCTEPNAALWMEYAKGYNEVMVRHINKGG
jgi:hypothetical protein